MLTLAIVAAVVLIGFVVLAVGAITVGTYLFNHRSSVLPANRLRDLMRDASDKMRKQQLDEDYQTLIKNSGYELEE